MWIEDEKLKIALTILARMLKRYDQQLEINYINPDLIRDFQDFSDLCEKAGGALDSVQTIALYLKNYKETHPNRKYYDEIFDQY
jgi:predicted RNA-binding protein with EMAP domain